eukprot:Opistho-2@23138
MHDQRDEGLSVIDKINERNRRKNIVDVHKAFVEAWKRDTGSGHASDGHESAADPFERRKCRPLLVRHTNSPSKNKRPEEEAAAGVHDAASDDAGGSAMHTATGTPALSSQVASPAPASVAGVNAAASTRKVDDPYKAHDFDFDIDIDVGSDRECRRLFLGLLLVFTELVAANSLCLLFRIHGISAEVLTCVPILCACVGVKLQIP